MQLSAMRTYSKRRGWKISTLQELHAVGVGFVSLTETLDVTTPAGRALAGVLAVFAEFEREILRDRVKAGIAQARKEGWPHGPPPTVRHHIAEIFALFARGVSKRQIASQLSISRASVQAVQALRRVHASSFRAGQGSGRR
jgi:DNA invertase Pin-like site-specific DNA recombinase